MEVAVLDLLPLPDHSHFKLEDYCCNKHRQPTGAVCSAHSCDNRLLCNDCVKEHESSHFHDIILGYTFSETFIIRTINQFLKERIPILQQHERTKEKMKTAFKTMFQQFKASIILQLEEYEDYITRIINESTKYTDNYQELKRHTDNLSNILNTAQQTQQFENEKVQQYLEEYEFIQRSLENMKKNFNYEQLQVILSNSSTDFLQNLTQHFNDFKTSWTKSFDLFAPHDLGSFLSSPPQLIQSYNDKVLGITYSEQDHTIAILEGFYKIHFYSDVFNLEKHFFRLGFSKFEDYLSHIKWGENGSLLICNNNNRWVKLHFPSKTYSAEISTATEGPIKKFGYFPELKLFIVTTEYWVICYQAGQTFMPVYYKVYSNSRITDFCLVGDESVPFLAVGNAAGNIIMHDVLNRTERYQFKAHNFGVTSMKYWKEKKILITTGSQGDIKTWKLSESCIKYLRRIGYDTAQSLTNLILISSHGWLIAVHNANSFIIYNIHTNKKIGMKNLEMPIINPCYIKEASKIIFGMDKGLYQLKI